MTKNIILSILISFFSCVVFAQEKPAEKPKREPGHYNISKFKQLSDELPTPNNYRTLPVLRGTSTTSSRRTTKWISFSMTKTSVCMVKRP